MPELPEVETVIRQLRPQVEGRKFWKFESKNASTFKPSATVLEEILPGKRIEKLRRHGKYIIFELSDQLVMVVHLRMTGMFSFEEDLQNKSFLRGIFTFTNGRRLMFSDIRKFGQICLYPRSEFMEKTNIDQLGFDPIIDGIECLNFSRGILKNTLLNQRCIAGIGNIYADEICFRSGLDPRSRVEKLDSKQMHRLKESIVYCLQEGIKHNGTTISDFRGTRGDSGKHQKYLQVYGRKDDPCYKCGSLIEKLRVAGRGTYICVNCQLLLSSQIPASNKKSAKSN